MGMYALVNDHEVKMTGMMSSIIKAILQVEEIPPYVILKKAQVRALATEMVRSLEGPRKLVSVDGIMASSDLWSLADNASIAGQLIAWVADDEQKYLEFA
jgi:hypothetical protein